MKPSTEALEAYTLYLRGRYCRSKQKIEALRVAIEYFEQAIRRDPRYARAYAGLADCYAMLGFDEYGAMPASEAIPRAKAAALKAVEIDKTLGEGHSSLALIALTYDWHWAVAEREFEHAMSLQPGSSPAHWWYALFLSAMGRHDESIRVITNAEAVDPLSLVVHTCVGRCHFFARRYDDALEQLRATLEMEPDHPLTYAWIARVYCARGQFREALTVLEKGMSLVGQTPMLMHLAGYASGVSGLWDEARNILAELRQEAKRRYVPPVYEAYILAGLGDRDEAFRQLDVAYEQRSGYLIFLRVDPLWDPLRSDPRFAALLKRMRLDF